MKNRISALAASGVIILAIVVAMLSAGVSTIGTVAVGIVGALVLALVHKWARRVAAEINSIKTDTAEMIGRQRRDTRTIANIAGSVGKMAPRVRKIETATSGVRFAEGAQLDRRLSGGGSTEQAMLRDPADIPDYEVPEWKTIRPSVTAMTILDEFSGQAFEPEWNQIPATPANWRLHLESAEIDLLFVESAWNGNDGAWLYHLVGPSAPRPAIIDLVAACKDRGIPTVFWNKEDPPHFADFLDTARLFDYVLTSDVNKIPQYRAELGHDRVGTLAFAAQPRFHNPARQGRMARDRDIAFGGMYFRHKYPERRQQMDFLLPAAADFSLDIFSRHSGEEPNYQFPKDIGGHVRGSLTYSKMLTAYHRYRIFINVNSVVDSASMCARRIFEITASGAAVVSPPSPAIGAFFPEGEISIAGDRDGASRVFRTLLRSEGIRDRKVHVAQRRVWEEHTYSHRVDDVLRLVGIESHTSRPTVSVILPTIRPENFEYIVNNLARQVESVELVLGAHGFEIGEAQRARLYEVVDSLEVVSLDKSETLGAVLNQLVQRANGELVSKFDDDDFYGANYLRDLVNASVYTQADVIGKAAAYFYFESTNHTALSYETHEHRFTDFIRGATLTAPRDVFDEVAFEEINAGEDSSFLRRVIANGGSIYAADRFNFFVNRRSNGATHTWNASDDELLAGAKYQFTGSPEEHVSV